MITQEVNAHALATAAAFVVGPEAALAISRLYKVIDEAMYAGYELGKLDGEAASEARSDAAFDEGFEQGAASGASIDKLDDAWSQGYIDGVTDARAHPGMADLTVAGIISDMTASTINGEFDIDNVRDSGDEQPTKTPADYELDEVEWYTTL